MTLFKSWDPIPCPCRSFLTISISKWPTIAHDLWITLSQTSVTDHTTSSISSSLAIIIIVPWSNIFWIVWTRLSWSCSPTPVNVPVTLQSEDRYFFAQSIVKWVYVIMLNRNTFWIRFLFLWDQKPHSFLSLLGLNRQLFYSNCAAWLLLWPVWWVLIRRYYLFVFLWRLVPPNVTQCNLILWACVLWKYYMFLSRHCFYLELSW